MKRTYPIALLALLIALATAVPVVASESVDSPLATLSAGPAGLSFLLADGRYEGYVLAVNGPGELSLRQTYEAGAAPTLSLFDAAGKPLPDGVYAYELHAVPTLSAALRAELDAARAAGDDNAANRLRETGALPAVDALVQSGYFSIRDSALIVPDPAVVEVEGRDKPAPAAVADKAGIPLKDFVILDDLIVDGSACVGFDCVNGEDFGFDTIRLKENNLRIKFLDTSGGNFPSNDWQLTANASQNGGANKFSIDDTSNERTPFTIEARAPSHSLYVDDGGRVGFGTQIPVAEAHVVSGNTPTLRLEQNGSSGFAPQTWDVAGNETSFFIRDVNNGSSLPFRIRPGAASDTLSINNNSNVGIGTLSPSQKLDVLGGDAQIRRTDGSQTSLFITSDGGGNPTGFILRANQAAAGVGGFTFTEAGANTPFRIFKGAASNTLDITTTGVNVVGTLSVNGVNVNVPDFAFEPDFPLETIEEHAAFMWENKHLPAVEPAQYDAEGRVRIDIGGNQMGMLEELEKAHVYIDQLNNHVTKLDSHIDQLNSHVDQLNNTLGDKNEELAALKTLTEALAARLARLEMQQRTSSSLD